MRWYILRTLLYKEVLRHLANRGGIVFAILLVCMAILLATYKPNGQAALPGAGLPVCYFHSSVEPAPPEIQNWLDYLQSHVREEWKGQLRFPRRLREVLSPDGTFQYSLSAGAIQIWPDGTDPETGQRRYRIRVWFPGDDDTVMHPYEVWFWRETQNFFLRGAKNAPEIREERKQLIGSADVRSGIAMGLVLFGLYFSCIYLLPSLTCEERERGVLLAQALSPAAPREILAAKFMFYPVVGGALSALIAGIYQPKALQLPFFWMVLFVAALGSLGIGLSIASLARTQRLASMGAMCYFLVIALMLFIIMLNDIPFLPYLFLQFHTPRLLHAALSLQVERYHYRDLGIAGCISLGWTFVATTLFRKCGWQ